MTEKKLVNQATGKFPTLSLSVEWMNWLKNREKIELIKPPREEVITKKSIDTSNFDIELFDILRKLRKEIAESRWVPPFMIFPDTALQQMAIFFPITDVDFLDISGVWEQKLRQFGEQFIWEIKEYITSHNINPKSKHTSKYTNKPLNSSNNWTNRRKSGGNAIKTRKLLKEWKSIEEISEILGYKQWTIINHIDSLIIEGKKCNLSHINLKKESIEKIQDSFNKHQNQWLKIIFDDLWWKYDYDTIRLARCIITNEILETKN